MIMNNENTNGKNNDCNIPYRIVLIVLPHNYSTSKREMHTLTLPTFALQASAGERTVRDLSFDESLGYPLRSFRRPSQGKNLPEQSLLVMLKHVLCHVFITILFIQVCADLRRGSSSCRLFWTRLSEVPGCPGCPGCRFHLWGIGVHRKTPESCGVAWIGEWSTCYLHLFILPKCSDWCIHVLTHFAACLPDSWI